MNKVSSNVLNQKADVTLLDEVKLLVRREKEIVVEVINYLKEIEFRKLHLARGYSSLFAFCTEFLGYSEAEAHIRIQAARLTQVLPEVSTLIERGELSLSVAAAAQSHFRKENLRRKESGAANLSVYEKREALNLISGNSRREAEQNLSIHFAQPSRKTFTFSADQELADKIEKLMDLMAHQNFDRDVGKMVELLVNEKLARVEKSLTSKIESQQKAAHKREGGGKPMTGVPARRSRSIPQKTKSLVWTKYEGRCAYIDPQTKRVCGNRHGVQIDHLHPLSKGGPTSPDNLTLLCSSHNKWKGSRVMKFPSPS